MRRGGGSRSSSRSSSRRSSRRHYGHSRRRGYYGGGYYGGHYRRNQMGPLGAVITIFMFTIFIVFIFSLILGTPGTSTYDLESNMTASSSAQSMFRDELSMEVILGDNNVTTYFFNDKPGLTGPLVKSNETYSKSISANEFVSSYSYMNDKSKVDITWSATDYVKLWIIKGTSSYNSWVNGDDVSGKIQEVGDNKSVTYNVNSPDTYYFIFENYGLGQIELNVDIRLELSTHDVSNAIDSVNGNFDRTSYNYDYVVIKNMSNDNVTVELTRYPRFSLGQIFLTLAGGLVFLLYLLFKKLKKSEKERKARMKTGVVLQNQFQPAKTSVFTQPNQSGYYQRPVPMYCAACGSGLVPNTKFCTTCGEKQ